MHLIHPKVLWIGLTALAILVVLMHILKHTIKYKGGIKAANTHYVKNLPEYQSRKKLYTVTAIVLEACMILSIAMTLVLVARPARKETVSNGTKKRDIFLCMDVSYSIYELNYDLVDRLEEVVSGLDGDRFGICIYNTSSVLYVPMTDDYDFINTKLEEIKEYFKLQKEYMDKYYDPVTGYIRYDYDEYDQFMELKEKLDYYDAGTLVNNIIKGSSLIGEGLASCMYSFPRLDDEDRTRVIIMSTDNSQEQISRPLVELDEAADLCKKNDIKVFGIFPNRENWSTLNTSDYTRDEQEFMEAVEKTGGKYYKQSETLSVDDIVNDIEREEALEVEEITITKINDQPQIFVYILCGTILLMLLTGLVMKI